MWILQVSLIFLEVREVCAFLREEKLPEATVVLGRFCSSLEDELGSIYEVQRNLGAVSPLLLFILKPGSFGRFLQVVPASQCKPPKIIRILETAEFMEGCSLCNCVFGCFRGLMDWVA